MKTISKIGLLIIMAGIFTISACTQKPTPTPEPEQEEYDEARVQFIPLDTDGVPGTDTTIIKFNAAGVPNPSHTHLHPNGSYRMLISLFYKGNPINQEIIDEGTEHKFFFVPSLSSGILSYEYNDADQEGNGIGLDGKITIGAGEFDLKIVLRHGLDKHHAAAQDWNSNNYQAAGGADDLNIIFEIHAEE